MISIVVPTIQGRERWLKRCLASYSRNTSDFELIVIHDKPTCGAAWNEGFSLSKGDYIHLTADDIEAHPGWWQTSIDVCDQGSLPAPRLLDPDGGLQACANLGRDFADGAAVAFTRVPFMSRQQAETVMPVIETHYSTDVWVSEIARLHGIQTVVSRAYLLTHHCAPEGRVDERLEEDIATYRREYEKHRRLARLPRPQKLWRECVAAGGW